MWCELKCVTFLLIVFIDNILAINNEPNMLLDMALLYSKLEEYEEQVMTTNFSFIKCLQKRISDD